MKHYQLLPVIAVLILFSAARSEGADDTILIGRNEHFALTLTSGLSDNMDVYIDSTRSDTFDQYWHNGEWLDFEVFQDTVYQLTEAIPFT